MSILALHKCQICNHVFIASKELDTCRRCDVKRKIIIHARDPKNKTNTKSN